MGGVGLIFLVIVAVVIVGGALVLLFGAVPLSRRAGETAQQLQEEPDQSLAYDVPEGQDVAAVMAALRSRGFESASSEVDGRQRVLIATPGGPDRQRAEVRNIIAHQTAVNFEGDMPERHEVRFVDE